VHTIAAPSDPLPAIVERKTARLTLLIDPRKKKLFEEICAAQDLTPSQVVRRLIRQYVVDHAGSRKLPPWLLEGRPGNTERDAGK
jgi:hypothetical protein